MLQNVLSSAPDCIETPSSICSMSISMKQATSVAPSNDMGSIGTAMTTFLSSLPRLKIEISGSVI